MNKKVGILVFLLVVLGLAGGLVLVQQQQETRRGAAGFASAGVRILPDVDSVSQSGDTINARIVISAGSEKVTSADLKLSYDPEKLEVVNVELNSDLFNYPVNIDFDSSPGDVWINGAATVPPDQMPTGDSIKFADLTIKVKDTGTISFDSSYENMVTGYNPGNDNKLFELEPLAGATYTLEGSQATATATDVPEATATQPEATATQPEATATQPAEDEDTLTFGVSFLGVNNSSSVSRNPVVDVLIEQGGQQVAEKKNVQLQPAGGKKFKGIISLSDLGSNYALVIKSKRHLSRRFCQTNQVCDGPGSLEFSPGTNEYDFSDVALAPGDINQPEKGQDDVVDTVDFSFTKTQLGRKDSPADIDYNGVVNGRDIVLILNVLASEEYSSF